MNLQNFFISNSLIWKQLPESLEALHTETVRVASQISHAIKTVKRKVWEHKAVVQDFMAVVRKSFRELSNFLQQFKAGKEVFQFYYEYQSWFEELHLSQQMQRSFNEIKRWVNLVKRHFRKKHYFKWKQKAWGLGMA